VIEVRRADHIERLKKEAFDILVIGGGITGAAVARDAVRRGFRTALVEARDFAEGTSSRSSRLVHGGLRYLEQFEFDLVFEASQERRRLLRNAPHLVRPLEFLFPIYRDGRVGKLKLDAGMWLYDALSLFRNIERHQMLSTVEVLRSEPRLRSEGLLGGARYYDAQVDDARLVLATVLGAIEAGAAVANRVEALEIDTTDWPGHAVRVRDDEREEEWTIDALAVVNATGPWTDRNLALAGAKSSAMLRPTRGTHIHVGRERIRHDHALIFESPLDRRIMFVLPWRDLTLIGTTDDFDRGDPARVTPTAADVQYLLDSTNSLFPLARLRAEDVLSAWAGLRPLVVTESGGSGEEGEVSRDFLVHEEPEGFFTIAGGKLTSHRSMAQDAVDQVGKVLAEAGVEAERRCDTMKVPLPGGDFEDLEELQEHIRVRAADLGLVEGGAERLVRAYGTRANDVLDLVRERHELNQPLVEDRPYLVAEAVYAVRAELTLRLDDFLYRRTHVALETREQLEAVSERAAAHLGPELGWSDERMEREIANVRELRARGNACLHVLRGGR
jgi:glycerol-3-phosphate dehydrogenase